MKNLFFTFALLCTTSVITAQNRIVDSLWQVYNSHPNDTLGILALEQIVNQHLSYVDPDSSSKILRQMRAKAKQINWPRGEYLYHKDYGFIENRRMKLDASLAQYDSAIIVAKRLRISYAAILGNMGGTYNRMGKYQQSIRTLYEALEMAQEEKNIRLQCSVCMNLSAAFGNSGDERSALKYGVQAAEIAEKNQIKDLVGRTYLMLYPSFQRVSDTANMRIYSEKVIALGRAGNNTQYLFQGYNNLSGYWINRAKCYNRQECEKNQVFAELALEASSKALRYVDQVKTPFERQEFWYQRARILTRADDGSHAEVVQALAKARASGQVATINQMNEWITLGNSFENKNPQLDSSLHYYHKAAQLAVAQSDYAQAVQAYRCMALCYADSRKNDFEKAYFAYLQYKIYEDSMLNADKVREMTAMEAGLGYEREQFRSKQEILRLNNEKLAQELRIRAQTDLLFRNKTEAEKREILLQLLGQNNEIQALSLRQKGDSLITQQLRFDLEQSEKNEQLAALNAQRKEDTRRRNRTIAVLVALLVITGLAFYIFRIRQKAAHQRKVSEVEMRALRAQMNPHFLFNSMNTINGYILHNEPHAASDYLSRFARVMRNILENSQQPSITLEKEIDLLKEYLKLEKMRVEKGLEFEIEIADEVDTFETRLPSMILQPFIENAIIHGIRPKKDGVGMIKVRIIPENGEKIRCIIEDNGVGRSSKTTSENPSMGLKITTDRLLLWHRNRIAQPIQFTDLKDSTGHATGTRVEIII
jgi:hypothetical protein